LIVINLPKPTIGLDALSKTQIHPLSTLFLCQAGSFAFVTLMASPDG